METPSATRVQQLIQEVLDSLKQFNTSWQRAGGSGKETPSPAHPSDTSAAIAADTSSTNAQEKSPPSKIKQSQDWSENVTEPGKELVAENTPETALATTQDYDLEKVRLAYEEFLLREARTREDIAWMDEFKAELDRISDGAERFTLNGRLVLTYRRNGNLNAKKLEAEHPDLVARYTRLVTEMKLDKQALERDEPEIYNAFKAKVFRVSPRARSSR